MNSDMERSFLEAYDAHADGIFRYCYFKLSDYEMARDMTQEVFVRTWEFLGKGREADNLKVFLYRVARNAVIDYYRKKKTTSLDRMQEAGFEPEDEVHIGSAVFDAEVALALEVLSGIDEKYREPVLLRYVEGYSPKEIGEMLDISENTASVRIHRGLKQFRERIERKK